MQQQQTAMPIVDDNICRLFITSFLLGRRDLLISPHCLRESIRFFVVPSISVTMHTPAVISKAPKSGRKCFGKALWSHSRLTENVDY